MSSRSSSRSACTRQSKRTCVVPSSFSVSVHRPVPRRSPSTSAPIACGASSRVIRERVRRWYGSRPLKCWRDSLPTAGSPSDSTDEVDRLPPGRVAAGVGDRGEHRLARRVDVPLVHEHVLARGAAAAASGGSRGSAPSAIAPSRSARVAPAVEPHPGEQLEELHRAAGRADLHPHAARALVAGELAVRRAGGHLHRVAGAEQVLAAVDTSRSEPSITSRRSDWTRVDVVLGDEAAGAADDVELEQLGVGVLADLEADAQAGGVEDVHAPTCAAAAPPDHPGGVSGFGMRPAAASSISVASRRSRVSGFFALVTQ